MCLSLSHVQFLASKVRNWQKFFCKMFHLQIRNFFFFFPGSLLSFLSHDESRCILSYSDYFLFEHSVIRGWNRKNPLFFSFNWSQMVARPGLIGCWLSTATPSTVRTQNQKCGTSGSHDPELCSITFTCLCDLWISISSNELAMTRQNPHCF